jgi:hypothetical protein
VAAFSLITVAGNTRLDSPPRFDGAGYAVLAESLASGRGYREIDHPDQPRHAHFPPGYPLLLAGLWRLTGTSFAAAHALSIACTVTATILFWAWFRTIYAPRVALALGLALAANWAWSRIGGSIQSEPVFLLLSGAAIWVSARSSRKGGIARGIALGLLLGGSVLARHVGICLALAVIMELVLRGMKSAEDRQPGPSGRRTPPRKLSPQGTMAFAASLTTSVLLTPWVAWVSSVGQNTQVALLPRSGLLEQISTNALFYLRRIPDLITGPIVEVGTVFRPALAVPVTIWAIFASAVVLCGWILTLARARRRLGPLVALSTLALLLIWPFQEAGRFLIPLAPMVLLGCVEGVARLAARLGIHHARAVAAGLVLSAPIPYSAYALLTDRAGATRRTHAEFDAACVLIASDHDNQGPVLTRHPGEVFWLTGRQALSPASSDSSEITRVVNRYGVAYILVDEERYANAPVSPLTRFAEAHPQLFERVWTRGRDRTVTLYVRKLGPPER